MNTPLNLRRYLGADHLGGSWHRPLLMLAGLMVLTTAVCLIGLFVDPRVVTGQPIWMKPLKFSLSLMIYALTWGWLIPQMTRFRRVAWWAGTISAIFLFVEMVVILAQVIRDTTSHYNVSTPFNAALWSAMGASILIIWVATLVVSVLLLSNPGPDRARNLAIRAGAFIALIGMGLAFLMTEQDTGIEGIAGAHAVGVPDGGPGIPFLGWSTTGGDLRIPHFIGMHGLQIIALLVVLLEVWGQKGSGRFARQMQNVNTRAGLIWVAALGYLALVALVTWQALRGQSLIHPDSLTLAAISVLVVGVGAGFAVVMRPRRSEVTG